MLHGQCYETNRLTDVQSDCKNASQVNNASKIDTRGYK